MKFRNHIKSLQISMVALQDTMTNRNASSNLAVVMAQEAKRFAALQEEFRRKYEKIIANCVRSERFNESCYEQEHFAFRNIYPVFLILSFIGCTMTLIVYRSKMLSSASTVVLLSTKGVANFVGICCLIMEMIRHYTPLDDRRLEKFYWQSRPFALFFANYFGTLAVWCTLMITLETYLCIAFPMNFRKWAKKRNAYLILFAMLLLDGMHHAALPLTRIIDNSEQKCNNRSIIYKMITRPESAFVLYEHIYFYVQCIAVIIVPNVSMMILSALIAFELRTKTITGQNFSKRRRCVVRITIATTSCYLLLETPNLIMFLMAAVKGSSYQLNGVNICVASVVCNFLAMLNAVAPFFVYVSINSTFRKLLMTQLAPIFGTRCAQSLQSRTALSCAELSRVENGRKQSMIRSFLNNSSVENDKFSCI